MEEKWETNINIKADKTQEKNNIKWRRHKKNDDSQKLATFKNKNKKAGKNGTKNDLQNVNK